MTVASGEPMAVNLDMIGDRQAMRLPPWFQGRSSPEDLGGHAAELLGESPDGLARIAEDPGSPFGRRYMAASLCGLAGDPRVRPEDPAMVDIPAARVRIGLAEERIGHVLRQWSDSGLQEAYLRKECPAHDVEIGAFRIMRYPVTNLEYRRFLEDTRARWLPTSWHFGCYPDQLANHPVWTVPPLAADAYADWLAARTGRAFRLPTEAEWEYAATGGEAREYPWGDTFREDAANTSEAGPLSTTPVGIYPAGRSPFGVLDLAGNVEEYTADDYRPYPGGELIADDLVAYPAGMQSADERLRSFSSYRIVRGGSFTRRGDLARCRRRHGLYDRSHYAVGFRLAESP
ncbi:formylglycine-generating enzyme family protein [Streptomyces sp. NBC_01477]|uniref:formylglycine-generating enzyme family protein n=1 Tax=Streptomyces sp. NBC_01477 TaxID=2976015 RepID=UPI002E3230C8|nr:SUMF1/EgtB/PvdO family nonheme iron enzyme [Streptomyces sp. NBC_01477]